MESRSNLDDHNFSGGSDSFTFEDEPSWDNQTDLDGATLGRRAKKNDLKRGLILATYNSVWREFYEWEQDYAAELLQSVAAITPDTSPDLYLAFDADSETHAVDTDEEDFDANAGGAQSGDVVRIPVTMCTWDESHNFSKERHFAQSVVQRTGRSRRRQYAAFREHPQYESCAPSNDYIFCNITAPRSVCEFIKYGDADDFDRRRYLSNFSIVGWQEEWRDPDCECLSTEVL